MVDYTQVIPGSPSKGASKDEWLEFLRESHGDIEDAKLTLLFLQEEEQIDVQEEDIGVVTDEPPAATFS